MNEHNCMEPLVLNFIGLLLHIKYYYVICIRILSVYFLLPCKLESVLSFVFSALSFSLGRIEMQFFR